MKMKNIWILFITFVLVMALCSCQSSTSDNGSTGGSSVIPDPETSSYTEEDALDYVYDIMGDTLVVKLNSNQSTGCSWAASELVNLEETESYYTQKESTPEMTGVGGIETHAFKAVGSGEASLILTYGQHWENGRIFEQYHVTVDVDDELNITDVQFQNDQLPDNEWNYAQEHPQNNDQPESAGE